MKIASFLFGFFSTFASGSDLGNTDLRAVSERASQLRCLRHLEMRREDGMGHRVEEEKSPVFMVWYDMVWYCLV